MNIPDHLSELIQLIPDGHKRPTEEHIETIVTIDKLVKGSNAQLIGYLRRLEKKARKRRSSFLGTMPSFRYRTRVERDIQQFVGYKRAENMPYFEGKHQERVESLKRLMPTETVEDGNLKSERRIIEKLSKQRNRRLHGDISPLGVPDFSRVRIVCDGIKSLERAYTTLLKHDTYACIGSINYYLDGISKYPTPFRGLNTYWIPTHDDTQSVNMSTEVQFVTRRARSLLDLNHSFDIAQVAHYPDQWTTNWVEGLFYKASILDFRELFHESL